MKEDKLTFFLSATAIILTGITACLSCIEPVGRENEIPGFLSFLNKDSYNWISNNKFAISLIAFLLVLILQIILYLYNKDAKKEWLEAYLKLIAYKNLGGITSEQRITVFVPVRGWRFFSPYVIRAFSHKNSIQKLFDVPNPFKRYLVPLVRFSHPERKHSYTYFRIAENKNEAESVVAYCYASAEAINVDTVDIDTIDMPFCQNKIKHHQHKKFIKTYGKETYMRSYKKIRLLTRKANHIYAIPIMQPEERSNRIWGVLVFDRISKSPDDSFKGKISEDQIREHLEVIKVSLSKIT